jgi:hypothetical protein
VLDNRGGGSDNSLYNAMNWIVTNRQRFRITVINLSLAASDPDLNNCVRFQGVLNLGLSIVAAAGEEGFKGRDRG